MGSPVIAVRLSLAARVCTGIALFLVIEAALVAYVDAPLSSYLRAVNEHYPTFIDIFRAYTDLGKSNWYLGLSAVGILACATLMRRGRAAAARYVRLARLGRMLVFLFMAVSLSGILTDAIKALIGRARPIQLAQHGLYGFHPLSLQGAWTSMPSGHATTAFALACVLMKLLPRHRLLWLALATLLAVSRVMINVHFFSDVLAGAVIGYLTAYALRPIVNPEVKFYLLDRIFYRHRVEALAERARPKPVGAGPRQ